MIWAAGDEWVEENAPLFCLISGGILLVTSVGLVCCRFGLCCC